MPDLVVLDWMLPGVSGIELCRRLRARPETERLPIIMLTARGEESERVRGLATGADDYVVKPFSVPELMARVQRAAAPRQPGSIAAVLRAGDLELDRETHRVRRSGEEIHLGPTEFRLLEFLMQTPGRVYHREQLLDERLGRRRLYRRAHGRRPYWPPPKSPQQHLRPRPNPHGPGVRLCIRRALRTGRLSRCAVIWRRMAASGTPQT